LSVDFAVPHLCSLVLCLSLALSKTQQQCSPEEEEEHACVLERPEENRESTQEKRERKEREKV